jgi:hypothetical protein
MKRRFVPTFNTPLSRQGEDCVKPSREQYAYSPNRICRSDERQCFIGAEQSLNLGSKPQRGNNIKR